MYCSNCGTTVSEQARYCPNCGSVVEPATYEANEPLEDRSGSESRMNTEQYRTRRFNIPRHEIGNLIDHLRTWLRFENFDTQLVETEDGGLLLQTAKRGGWRKLVGMDTAVNVLLYSHENVLTVHIGAGRWLDKAVAGGVGIFLVWPLAITAGFGAYEQMRLPDRIFDQIDGFRY